MRFYINYENIWSQTKLGNVWRTNIYVGHSKYAKKSTRGSEFINKYKFYMKIMHIFIHFENLMLNQG